MQKNQVPKEIIYVRDSKQEMHSIAGNERILRKNMEPHWHSFVEIDMVTGGNGEQVINGESTKLARGVITIIKPTDWHSITVFSPIHFTRIAFDEKLLPSQICEHLYHHTTNLCLTFEEREFDVLERLASLLIHEQQQPNMNILFVEKMLEAFFIKLLCMNGQTQETSDASHMQKAISYIHQHFAESPSLTEVAALLHYNPRYFSTVFKKVNKVSYLEYLNRLKVNQAKKNLLYTQSSISFISDACGFVSPVTFRRVFRAYCGMTPREFRNLMLSESSEEIVKINPNNKKEN